MSAPCDATYPCQQGPPFACDLPAQHTGRHQAPLPSRRGSFCWNEEGRSWLTAEWMPAIEHTITISATGAAKP